MAILTRFLSIQLLVAASVSCGAQELLPDLPLAGHADEISRSQRVTGGTTTPWVLQLRGSESDAVRALAVSPDGSILVAGQFEAEIEIGFDMLVSAGDSDAFLARLSPLGEPIWAVRIGGPGFDAASGVAVDRDGNATVVGEFSGSVTFEGGRLSAKGGRDLFAIAFTPDGVARWSSAWGGAGWETVDAAAAAPDGGVLVAGARVGEVAIADRSRPDADVDPTMDVDVDVDADADGFLTRIAPGGARTWTVRLGGRGWDQAHAIAVGPDGTIAVAGSFADRMSIGRTGLSSAGLGDAFVASFAPDGETRWAERLGGPGDDAATAVTVTPDGAVAVAGRFAGRATMGRFALDSGGEADLFLAVIDPSGRPLWARRRGGAGFDSAGALAVLGDGTLLVAGQVGGERPLDPGRGPGQIVVARYTPSGETTGALYLSGSFVSAGALAASGPSSAVLGGWFIRDIRVAGRTLTTHGNTDGLVVAVQF